LTYEALEQRAGELESEIYRINRAEKMLRRQNEYLTALHETAHGLIDHIDKKELGENVLNNVKKLIDPYLERLKKSPLNTNQETLVNILNSNLNNKPEISPFIL
jgi:hypothetical protein